MENATKALIIAAGILLTIMLVSLIIIFVNQMSGYYTEKHNSQIVEQTTKFNSQFENYNEKTIRGNELLSVMNKVANYNHTAADMEKYDIVEMNVDLKGYQDTIEIKYNSSDTAIFTSPLGTDNIADVTGLLTRLISDSNIPGISDTKLQKLSAEIDNIVKNSVSDFEDNSRMTAQQQFDEYKENRAQKLTRILGYKVDEDGNTEKYGNILNNVIKSTHQYYQITQFKRAMFYCTGVKYDTENGRVNRITFEIKDEGGKVKFE